MIEDPRPISKERWCNCHGGFVHATGETVLCKFRYLTPVARDWKGDPLVLEGNWVRSAG